MKNLIVFEEFSKSYGEKITLDQFKSIEPGSEVTYLGSRYEVEKNDGFVLTLKSQKTKGTTTVNYSMFNHGGFIKESLNEKKPAGAPDWHDSDAPDAEGRFRDLGIKDLAAWLIKTRKKDVKKISGSITQQIVFNRKKNPEYADKMEKVRKEVYKQLGREDLLKEDAKISLGGAEPLEIKELEGGLSFVQKSKIGSGKNVIVIPAEYIPVLLDKLEFYQFHNRVNETKD